MSYWTFSPSSMPYLQRCIAAAPPPDPNNKWFQTFGKKDSKVESVHKEITDTNVNNLPTVKEDATISYEDFFDTIENESIIPAGYIMEECSKNARLITQMALKLSANTVEQLFKQFFSKKDVETVFLTTFITTFLPAFIKVNYSRLCIDLLVKINEEYPQIFKELLQILITDTEIHNHVLINYIAVLNEESITSFIETLSTIEMSSEEFTQNVLVINTAYKDCIKNDFTQKYIQKMIVKHSKDCASERNYGRLFLTFLQNEKAMGRKRNVDLLEKCLDVHRSPFKRPCSMLLKDIK